MNSPSRLAGSACAASVSSLPVSAAWELSAAGTLASFPVLSAGAGALLPQPASTAASIAALKSTDNSFFFISIPPN